MELVLVTGLSGAGKSRAVVALEDIGFYCVDNMPPALIPKFVEICIQSQGKIEKVAIVTDVRGGDMFRQFNDCLDMLDAEGYGYKILFLDASDAAIVKRYKETRRQHPLARNDGTGIIQVLDRERQMLSFARQRADYIIDTTNLSAKHLREHIHKLFLKEQENGKGMVIDIMSFGFKYGIPIECDIVFDVRFLPNPFYIEQLRKFTGLSKEVYDYVFSFEQTKTFEKMATDMLKFLIPHYIEEGKTSLVIGIGCTGGKHRSVAIARKLGENIKDCHSYIVVNHRDIYKDNLNDNMT